MRIALILAGLILSFTAPAFQGDWVLAERFRTQLQKAQQGDAAAQYDIGHMYEKGRGTTQDSKQALNWLERSAKQQYGPALARLGVIYFEGSGSIKPEFTRARHYLERAAGQDIAQSQFYLGRMFEEGKGVIPDADVALSWYRKARKGGFYGVDARITALESSPATSAPATPKPVIKKRAAPATRSALKRILASQWKRGDRPAAYLPSDMTHCQHLEVAGSIVCTSKAQTRTTLSAKVTYTTRARLSDFQADGRFHLSYRNQISDVKPVEGANGQVRLSTDSESPTHTLECRLTGDSNIKCVRDKIQNLEFVGS